MNSNKLAERGAAAVEYALLLGAGTVISVFGMQSIGGSVEQEFSEVPAAIAYASEEDPAAIAYASEEDGASLIGWGGESLEASQIEISDPGLSFGGGNSSAPAGSSAGSGGGSGSVGDGNDRSCANGWRMIPNVSTKANGKNVDKNGDGVICEKQIPGKGKGNSNSNTNIKDNNGK